MAAVYKIVINECDKFYIGSAVNFGKRRAHHLSELRGQRHANRHLQNCYKKYGEAAFKFIILEEVEECELLLEREQEWIDKYSFDNLINICRIAGNTTGRRHTLAARRKISKKHHDVSGENNPMYGMTAEKSPNYGKKHSIETKKKISNKLKGRKSWCEGKKRPAHSLKMTGEKNPFYGKEHSAQTKERLSRTQRKHLNKNGGKKLTLNLAKEIRRRYNEEDVTITKLAKEYNINRTYCGLVIRGIYWKENE